MLAGQTARLSQAALETLAIVAYQQPVSRGRIAAVRGVNVDGVVRTLLTRKLIEEAGPDLEGGALTYRTTGTSWSGWACATCPSCRRWRRCCRATTSWPS